MPEPPAAGARRSGPCAVVIFGASGDLTQRKLLPALWNLRCEGSLPDEFAVIGAARKPLSTEEFREAVRASIRTHSRFPDAAGEPLDRFLQAATYLPLQYHEPDGYRALQRHLEQLDRDRGTGANRLFYLATPPAVYEDIAVQLGACGLVSGTGDGSDGPWSRIIVEKPFGRDLDSARQLNATLKQVFRESQIYRIDHYLGKETVQNLLVFRFANGIFEPIWDHRYVDHVQIMAAESLGLENRGGYYDRAGALRDMIQNHLLQLLCLVAMEPPTRLTDRSIRNEKSKVLEAIRPIAPEHVWQWTARGQYAAGVMDGARVPGYLHEEGVDPASTTETYAAVKFMLDNWRWAGVPFYLRSGKRMAGRVTEVSIHFRKAPHLLFREIGDAVPESNVLAIRIQPNEGIDLRFSVKVPGTGMYIRPVTMRFDYEQEFHHAVPEAYERLLLDCMLGDVTLFSRDDWMELSWALIDPILATWEADSTPPPQYRAGTWGPREADALLARDGHYWWIPE